MIYDLQKASILKRISAWLLDFILVVILAAGVMWLMSVITGFDGYYNTFSSYRDEFRRQFYIEKTGTSAEEFDRLTEESKAEVLKNFYDNLDEETIVGFNEEFSEFLVQHDGGIKAHNMLVVLPFLITSVGLLIPVLVFELIIPLCLKDGRTVGKKVFNLGVVFKNSVKVTPAAMFVRAVLGKYTIEIMVPLLLLFVISGIVGIVVMGMLLIMQIVLLIATKTNSLIHDVLSNTVVVDMQTQMVFNSVEELTKYKEDLHQEEANKAQY